MFGLESIWNDPDWPTLADLMKKYKKTEEEEKKPIVDNTGLYLYNKLNEK